jgi:hypothetical protein
MSEHAESGGARRRRPALAPVRLSPHESLEQRQLLAVTTAVETDFFGLADWSSHELVVLDASLASDHGIVASFGRHARILVEPVTTDLFATVSAALEANPGVSSIHLVSHGAPGRFTLGNTLFEADSIDEIGASLIAWNRLAAPGADLYLWGCDIAGGDGASLVDAIHSISGFDVAASIDVTGPTAFGGDFDLEYVVGDVDEPSLIDGVDVLWETTLSDHAFTTASKQAVQDAFDRLANTIAPAIRTAVAGKTGSSAVDPLAQRTISDLFTASSSISPADLESFLSLATTASTYLAGSSPTLSGLAAAINSALAAKASAAGATAPSITVTPTVAGSQISLAVSITAAGSAWADIDQGTDAAPTAWGQAIRAMNSDYGATFRAPPQVRAGSRLSTGFTVSVDLTDPDDPMPSITIDSTTLEAGVFDFGPSLRFGILDATIGGSQSLPYATSISFSGGATKSVADWSSVGASASSLSSAPSATVDLPITATLSGVGVAPGAAFRVAFTDLLGVLPPVVSGISLGRLPWFGNISSDDIIVGVKQVGGAYDTLGTTEALMASVPFVPRQSLGKLFDFAELFDDAIGSVIDVTVEKTVGSGSSAQTIQARPDNLQTLADFQAYPAFAGLGITPVYDDTAGTVSLQFSASQTTPVNVAPEVAFNLAPLGALTFTGGTAPALSPAVSLGFGIQFEIGPGGPIVLGLGADPATSYRLSGDATFTVTPVGGSATKITVTKASTETNTSLADLIADVNAVLGSTALVARESEFGAGIELYTPTVNSSMPIGITVAATRNQAALDLGFSDGIELTDDTKGTPISIFGRPSGVKSLVVPHADPAKKFADSSFDWSLADLSGSVAYGINTIGFGDTSGGVQAVFSAVLGSAGATPDDLAIDPVGMLSPQFTDSASLTLQNLSRVGGTNDIAATATIAIAVSDFLADRIDSFVAFGAPLSVPGLEDSGRGTGRLSADATVRFTIGSDTYEVTVTQAVASNNAAFQDLVSDFNVALSGAVRVVNGTPTSTMTNLSGEVSFVGSGGRVSVMHTAAGVTYPVLENLLVANLAPGGSTTGRLTTNSTLSLVRGPDTYTVTVPASATADNTTFADLVADFNAALATAQEQSGSTTSTVDATGLLRFTPAALAGRIQPEAIQQVANPNFATVTLPPTADLGEIGFQAGLSVPNIASALTQASRVFDTIERDLKEFNATELPLLNQSLGDLIELDAGLAGRIAAFGKLSASTPQELERALETSLGVPSSDLRITYDSVHKAYRIDFAYRASKATTIAFDVDLYKYYEQLGRVLPKGIDALTDGESKTPLNVVLNATSVLSVGFDLTTNKTFLYGHDGSTSRGLTNGTSFTISFSVNGQNLQFPAKFGLDVRKGVARLQNGSLAVTLAGPAGTPASSLFYVEPGAGQLAARDVASYRAAFAGAVSVKMPIFENFAPGTLTQTSSQEAQESGIFGFIQDHPASFYLAMPSLAGYLDARGRMEAAQTAITSLLSRGQTVDADGVSLTTWRERLNLAAADLGGVLFAFAPELENARNVLGAEETLLDFIRDPGMILDKLNAAVGGVESALKGLDKIPLPFMEGKLGGAVNSVFSFRTGWLLEMRNKMRNAGEGIFDAMREGVFEYLGPKNANILLKYDPVSMDRSLDSMTAATRPEDIGVVFMDKKRNVLTTEVRGADAFEIVFRLGQKVFDTGIDMSFQLDALESIGVGAAFDGGLRLQVGWEMVLGFGYSLTDGFYLKVDGTQPEAQLRFDATLTGASKDYTQRWDASGGYWKIVDTKGTTITTDDQDVIDATTGQPYRALAVNKFGADVTSFVATDPAVADPCGCGDPPSATTLNEQVWWVVATRTGNGDYVPAELNEQGRYVPQASSYPHTLVEVTAMAPAQLSGSLFFLRLAATDQIRRGLSGFTDVDSQYYYDGSEGPQTTAAQRDDAETGVNRNNQLPTRFTASVGVNLVDPSTSARKNSVREDILAPAGHGTRRVVNEKGQDLVGTSGAIYKRGTAIPIVGGSIDFTGWALGGQVDREIQGVFAKKYYDLRLKIAPPAEYEPLDIPVRVATGANIALSGMGIIDGVQLKVGDRVLVKNQTIASQNGIYTVSPGTWSRSFDANDNLDFVGKPMFVLVTEGRSNKDTGWNLLDTTGTVALGTTPLIFERTMVSVFEPGALGQRFQRLKPYVPYQVMPILADWVDNATTHDIKINIEFSSKNYLVTLPAASGPFRGPAMRAAQLNQALANAVADDNKNLVADAGEETFNLAQAGFVFQLPASAEAKWYRIEFAHLVEDNQGFAKRHIQRVGNFIDYGTPAVIGVIDSSLGWDPVADINADTTKNRLTWSEFRATPVKSIFALDYHATAVANLTMELSIGDTASSQNLAIPRIYADLNIDWSTRAARAKIDKAKQAAADLQTNPSVLSSGSDSGDEPDISLVKRVQEEEGEGIEKPSSQTTGGDKGIDPASPLVKEMDLKPEIGFSNIRLDVGSFLTDFLKPVVDKAEPYLAEVRPILTFLNSAVPVLSDVAGRTIKVVDLLEKFGGPKAQGIRGVIDTVTAIDNLVAQIAALPAGVNIQVPMGRFWFPKVPDPDKGGYKYGSFVYDNVALGINTNNYTDADRDAEAALQALASLNPDSATQKNRQSAYISNNARDRGGIRVPILEDPATLFQLMMGQTATLVTYQLPKLNYSFEKSIPLLRIVVFEVGLRASFELNSNLAFGFDTYGINQYMVSGDAADIAQGFYVSDRANADGTGADVPEFQAIVSLGLYGGVDLVAVKAGIEGGVRVVGEVNLNDPDNDGKLRLTEAIGLVVDTGNPLDLFDLSLRGEAYARYYYEVGFGLIKGGKDFARIEIFNLSHEGSDGTPVYASVVNGSEGAEQLPGTLLLHVGEAAPKRVSNQDPLKAKDGAESYVIWNDSPGSSTVHVKYVNYSGSRVRTYSGVQRVLFEGGIGSDSLDASGLRGLPVTFDGGDGDDTLILGSGHAEIVSRLVGGDGNDTIRVNGDGIVEIYGGVGNDTLVGGTGIVRMEAGEGNDSVTTSGGSFSTIVMGEGYGIDTAALAAAALENLLDFTRVASAIEFLLDGGRDASQDGRATAGEENVLTFNVAGATEIRGSTQADSFTVRNPRTRNASRARIGVRLDLGNELRDLPEMFVPNLAPNVVDSAGNLLYVGKLANDSSLSIDIGRFTYTVTVTQAAAANNISLADLLADFDAARTSAKRLDRSNPAAAITTVDATRLFSFLAGDQDANGLLLRGGQGDDLYDFVLDSVANVATDGILIDDVQAVVPAVAGTVTTCGPCKKIESIAVASGGKGYELPPQVMIIDPTGSGARATAVIDELGRVTAIQVIEGGSNYTSPTVLLIAPRSLNDKFVVTRNVPGLATLSDPSWADLQGTTYRYTVEPTVRSIDNRAVRFVGWGDGLRPAGLDQSEIDSVTVNMPEGVLFLKDRLNLFQTFTVDASRVVQNARIVADTVKIETDHGFQVNHPINTVNNGDVSIRVTGDGSATGQGDLNARRATAVANVSAGGVTGLTLTDAGDFYHFTPSITVGSDGVTPGTGARFVPTISTGGSLTGFARVSSGSGYYVSPAPVVVIPPPASIQVDAMITSSRPNNPGLGDGRGRVLLYADTGMVSTSGEVFFPVDARPGTPQGSRTIDWIGGDFRYRSTVGLDDLIDPTAYPGISVGTGAEFTAVLDADGRVTGFTRVSGGSGYTAELPPLVEIEGLATAVPVVGGDGSIVSLRVTYPGDGYGQPPRVTIKPNGFGRLVDSPGGATTRPSMQPTTTTTTSYNTPLNRVHIRSIGGRLVTVAGAGVGDPLKPIKSDVETFAAQVTGSGGVHILEKDGLRIGKDQSVSGITTVNGDVTITTFGGTLELGAPRQALDEEGRPLWQDAAKTIPIYDRDPETGRIIYEGGDIAVGSGDVKLTADDVEVNVDLNASGGSGTITLQPVRVDAEIGLAGTRARTESVITNGRLTGFDASKFWGGRGYTTAPLVIVDPAGQRAYASAVIEAGAVVALDVIYGGTNYDPDDPPFVSIGGGGIGGALPTNQANAVAIVGDDGVITGFTITNPGSGYVTTPTISIASPGQALVQAVLDTANPDPVTGRFAVKEFVVTNPGRNYQSAPFIEVAAPYDFTLDADEVDKFAESFAQVVIGRIEGQHLFHSPEAAFNGAVVLRAPRSGGTLDVASFTTSGPVSIVGSGSTFHLDAAAPTVSGTAISIDDNVIVHADVAATITATAGAIQIFGSGKGMIDGDGGSNEDLVLAAQTAVSVTGAIGSRDPLDDLTITSVTRAAIALDQSVAVTGDLAITAGSVGIGGAVVVGGDLVIDAAGAVAFSGDVSVTGDLRIIGATGVTFAGLVNVTGDLIIVSSAGSVRFQELATVGGEMRVTAPTLVEVQIGLIASADVVLTGDAIDFKGGIATVLGGAGHSLTLQPFNTARPMRVGSPIGTTAGTLDISDADLAAIAAGWGEVVIGDATSGTGAVTVGSIGTRQGSRNSWLTSTTTIVGGSVNVTQKVDVSATAEYLRLVGRTGDVTVNAAINETAAERNAWVRLEASGAIAVNAAVRSTDTVTLISGSTTTQSATAPIMTAGLRITSGGPVTLENAGNAFDTLAVTTTDDAISIREDSGYTIGTVDGVSGIVVGAARATLRSGGVVDQTAAGLVTAAVLDLVGTGGMWTLTEKNTIGTLTADTGSLSVADAHQMTVGLVLASKASGTAVELRAPSGLTLADTITTAGGDAILHDAVVLSGDIVIDVVDGLVSGEVEFRSSVNGTASGEQSLTVFGDVDASGSIGLVTALESLSVSGDSTFAGGIVLRTTGDQTYTGEVASTGTITVQAGSSAVVKFLDDVTLGGLVTATGDTSLYSVVLSGARTTVTNAVTFANTGSVTLGDGVSDDVWFKAGVTSVAPATTNLAGTIRTTNAAARFGQKTPVANGVTLKTNTTISTGTGSTTFSGAVDGGYRLLVNASGDTTFSSAVGGKTALIQLETDAPGRTLLDGGSVRTSGVAGQVYGDAVMLGATTTLSAGTGAITFAGTLDGAFFLTANTTGATTFGGAVGGTTALTRLITSKGGTTAINGGLVRTSSVAGQVYSDAVTLGADTTLDAGSGVITLLSTLDGAFSLAANTTGVTTFGGAVGGTTALESLATNAGGTTVIRGGSIKTSDAAGQVYGDAVTLGANTVLDAAAGAIRFANTLNGAFSLVANTTGLTTFGGAVGGKTALVSLITNAGGTTAINGGSVRTSGVAGQVYGDAVTLGATTTLNAGASAITIASTLDGAFSLVANTTGLTTFGGVVGGRTALVSLTTNAGGTTAINGGSVRTSNSSGQVYGDAVTLGANTVLEAAAGLITFSSTLDGAFTLAANTTRTTTFGGAVGGKKALESLATNAGGTTAINGGLVRTSGVAGQVYGDAVTLGANTTLEGTAIAFGSTLQGASRTLSIDAGTTGVVFGGTVGTSLQRLGTMKVASTGGVTISGDVFSAGPVTIRSSKNGITMANGALVDAGAGTLLFDAASSITLGGLLTTNATADAVRVTSSGGSITDGGDLDREIVATAAGAVVTLRAATGIGSGNPLEIAASSVEATTADGGIGLAAIGDLSIGAGGLSAPGSVALSATGSIRVPSGGAITSGTGVTANKPILWSVLNTADSGVGSLRQVIANANATGVEGVASFTGKNLAFTPAAPLPTITTKFTIDGTAHQIVIDGRNTIATGLSLSAGSAGSGIRGITIKGFTGTGIVVDGSTGTTISGCVIQANGNGLSATGNLATTTVVGNTFDRNLSYGIVLSAARGLAVDANTVTSVNSSSSMGLYATGDLTGTKVTSNTFSSGLRGALLDSARNLVFGEAGRGNTLLNNRPVAGSDFAGTGIRAQGNLAGTTVRANTFSGNNYGMAFINAQNLVFGGLAVADRNTIQDSSITAIYVEGNCTGSTATGTAYGPGNANTILRVKGSTGL